MSTKINIVEYNFVETLDTMYQCSICTELLKMPHLTECCGHNFCAECLQKCQNGRCPHCREESFIHIHDKRLQREINELKVFCCSPSRKLGCTWEGRLLQLGEHLKTCGFVQIKCVKCAEPVLRKDTPVHLATICKEREVSCSYCQRKGPYSSIYSLAHMPNCTGYPVLCPSGCTTKPISCSLLQHHLQHDCPNAMVECPLKKAGCQAKIQKKDISSHMSTDFHVKLVMDTMKMLTRYKETMEASVTEATSEIDKLLQPPSSLPLQDKTQLTSIRNKLGVHWLSPQNTQITLSLTTQSRPFYINDGYKFRILVNDNKKSQTVSINILQGEHDDKIKWPPNIDLHTIILHSKMFSFNLGTKQCHPLPSSKLCGDKSLEICKCEKDVGPATFKKTSEMSFTLRLETPSGFSVGTYSLVPKMTFLTLQKQEHGQSSTAHTSSLSKGMEQGLLKRKARYL